MKNIYFESAFFKHIFSKYKLEEAEASLCNQKIKPLLDVNTYESKTSKYFRFMNKLDYSELSLSDREYIKESFTNESDIEQNGNRKNSIDIYNKLIETILSRQKGYTVYSYDGTAIENYQSNVNFSTQIAPNNYTTFGIYYQQFDENSENDDFRNYNIVAEIADNLQTDNIAIILFSEVDVYKRNAMRL